jgi:bifunctional DNA-binding transcriptional regulator/antitoxin component of YhaV-PrlF toxin-antitoxin module
MITIPLNLRKKYHLFGGTELVILEDEGKLVMIPLVDIEAIRPQLPTKEELAKVIDVDDQIELELED